MTNRVSFLALEKRDFYRKIKLAACMPALIFPLRKSGVLVFSWHGIKQHYSACPRIVSFQDTHRKIHPNDRHILWHCRGHTGGIWNHVSPCGNNSYPVVQARCADATALADENSDSKA